ncbi:hypothetical protein [Pseudoduganella sp. OTU4001]|uniref:hypothetical protein n=1 Tax=Pseudoduganella sp. OTU4001 TaxID=3043854 RepID=UPI00313A8AF7
MRTVSKALPAILLACCAQASADSQHGEITAWQAAGPDSPSELRWKHDASGNFSENISWLVEPQAVLHNPHHPDQGLRLERAYVAARGAGWDVRAGRQLFDWSLTDTISPADVLNPRDWSDITRVRKLATPALSVRYGAQTSIEAVWMPGRRKSLLPGRWPAQQAVNGAQYALRLAGNAAQTDWSVVYFDGEHVAPTMQLAYEALRVLALTAARQVAGDSIVRAEAAQYRQGERPAYLRYVASIDKELSDVFSDGDTLYGVLQYAGSTQGASAFNAYGWPDFQRILERSAMFKLTYDFRSDRRTTAEFSGAWNTRKHDSLWQASIAQAIGPSLTLTAGAQLPDGRKNSFWGAHRGYRRLTLQAQWKY